MQHKTSELNALDTRSRWAALALAERLTLHENRHWWVIQRGEPAPEDFNRTAPAVCVAGATHHRAGRGSVIPSIRIASETLLLARDAPEAEFAKATLEQVVHQANQVDEVGGAASPALANLHAGNAASWLAWKIDITPDDQLRIRLDATAWSLLSQLLASATRTPLGQNRALQRWLTVAAPTLKHEDPGRVHARMTAICRCTGHDHGVSLPWLRHRWHRAHRQWQRLRRHFLPPARR